MPAGNPPFKERYAVAASHRYAMATLAAASNKDFIVSDYEAVRQGKSYTVDTLQMLRERYPGDGLFFILGSDAFLDMPKWREPERLTGMTDFIIVGRPGFGFDAIAGSPYIASLKSHEGASVQLEIGAYTCYSLKSGRSAFLVPVTQMDISSSGIRRLLEEKKSVKYLLPAAVEGYIKKHKLYQRASGKHEDEKV